MFESQTFDIKTIEIKVSGSVPLLYSCATTEEKKPTPKKNYKKIDAKDSLRYRPLGSIRFENIKDIKAFGQRMAEAREICGYSGVQAAALLGYTNSTKLSKVENGSDTSSVPLWLLKRASNLYQVSTDFLLSESDDWEKDLKISELREVHRFLLEHFERAKVVEINAIRKLHERQCVIVKAITGLFARAKENLEAMQYVKKSNPDEWDELVGGPRLLRLLAETAEDAMGLSYELKKLRAYNEISRDNANVDIFEDEE